MLNYKEGIKRCYGLVKEYTHYECILTKAKNGITVGNGKIGWGLGGGQCRGRAKASYSN